MKELKNLNESELNSVAGGTNGFRNKAIASALSFLTMAQGGAGIASAKGSNEARTAVTQTSTASKQVQSLKTARLSARQIAGITAGAVGTVFIGTIGGLILDKDIQQLIVHIKLSKLPFEKVLEHLPNNWQFGKSENKHVKRIENHLLGCCVGKKLEEFIIAWENALKYIAVNDKIVFDKGAVINVVEKTVGNSVWKILSPYASNWGNLRESLWGGTAITTLIMLLLLL